MAAIGYQQISLRNEIYRDLRMISHRWEELIFHRNDRVSLARGVELLLAHAKANPPTPEFIEDFQFRTPRPGRRKPGPVESFYKPTVSEEQLDPSEDEEKTTHRTNLPYDGGCGGIDGT